MGRDEGGEARLAHDLHQHGEDALGGRGVEVARGFVGEEEGGKEIGGKTFQWAQGDVFVAPSWSWRKHRASKDATLFSFSDRVVQEKLDLWREDRGNQAT